MPSGIDAFLAELDLERSGPRALQWEFRGLPGAPGRNRTCDPLLRRVRGRRGVARACVSCEERACRRGHRAAPRPARRPYMAPLGSARGVGSAASGAGGTEADAEALDCDDRVREGRRPLDLGMVDRHLPGVRPGSLRIGRRTRCLAGWPRRGSRSPRSGRSTRPEPSRGRRGARIARSWSRTVPWLAIATPTRRPARAPRSARPARGAGC